MVKPTAAEKANSFGSAPLQTQWVNGCSGQDPIIESGNEVRERVPAKDFEERLDDLLVEPIGQQPNICHGVKAKIDSLLLRLTIINNPAAAAAEFRYYCPLFVFHILSVLKTADLDLKSR